MAGYVVRYVIPLHLHMLFRVHLRSIAAPHEQDLGFAMTLYTVSGNAETHRKIQEFMKDCKKERRTLLIANWNVEKVETEVKMWGLKLHTVRRGVLMTRTTIVGDTVVLDRLERYLSSQSML